MKPNPKLDLLLCALAVMFLHGIWDITWGAPEEEPALFEYQTFRWPAGTATASYCFKLADPAPGQDVLHQGGKLDEILKQARQLEGYDECGTAGDTIILRRVKPDNYPTPDKYSGLMTVQPDRAR